MNLWSRATAVLVGIAAVLTIPTGGGVDAATKVVKAGQTCQKVGQVVNRLTCTVVGKKRIYRATPATTSTPVTAPPKVSIGAASSLAPTPTSPVAGATKVVLNEWGIETPAVMKSGAISYQVTNTGKFAHDFVIVEGVGYADLPKLPGGAVDEAVVKIAGRTPRLKEGESYKLDVTLKPGGYVFYCSIIFGPTNHAEKGQILSATIQ